MFKNYLKIIIRNLIRNKLYSVINILGLSLGIALCLLIALFIKDELTFDHFHQHLDSLYYLRTKIVVDNAVMQSGAQAPLGPTLAETFPEIEEAVRVHKETFNIKAGDSLYQEQGLSSDPNFFSLFSFPLIKGNPKKALSRPDGVVITAELAQKLFNDKEPLGQSLSIKINDKFRNFMVSGVTEDVPHNSSLRFQFITPLETIWGKVLSDWESGKSIPTFVRLSDPNVVKSLVSKFPHTIDRHLGENLNKESGYSLHALADYHLRGGLTSALEGKSSIAYSYILSGIGFLVLLIACFNFTNLSTGNASSRLEEIGIRKTLGARRLNIAGQFLMESIFISFLSLLLAFLFASLFLPAFNSLSQKTMSLNMMKDWNVMLFLILLPILVGCLAGGYPALILSRYTSVDLFRGKMKLTGKHWLGRALIIFQFSISIFLITMTIFLYRQHLFLIHNPLGYDVNQVMEVSLRQVSHVQQNNQDFFNRFKQRLQQHTAIKSVSGSQYNMTAAFWAGMAPRPVGEERRFLLNMNYIDPDFIKTMGMSVVQGNDFSEEMTSLADAVIVNKTFTKKVGAEDPVGKQLSDFLEDSFDGEIIGVVKDFHYQSLHESIQPALLKLLTQGNYHHSYVRFQPQHLYKGVEIVRSTFKKLAPDTPFMFSFLDDQVAAQYDLESRWNRMVQCASVFALIIAGSGLFAMTLLVAVRRTKEVAIRKTLGASVTNILTLFQKEFIGLVAVANIIAWPVAYFLMKRILQNYAYRIQIDCLLFALAGLAALLLASGIIAVHGIRTANANPVDSLRYE